MLEPLPRKRPLLVTLLALGVLSLTALNGVRFGAAIASWDLLSSFAPRPGPLYIALTGLIWILAGLPLIWGLWFGLSWARRVALPMVALYTVYYWFDRLIFHDAVPRANWLFAISMTIIWLAYTFIALAAPGSRIFFTQRETHD